MKQVYKISTKFIDTLWEADSKTQYRFLIPYDIRLTYDTNIKLFFMRKDLDINVITYSIKDYGDGIIPKLLVVQLGKDDIRKIKVWYLLNR